MQTRKYPPDTELNKHAQKGGLIEDISCHRSLLDVGLFFDKQVRFVIILASVFYPPQIASDHLPMLIRIQLLCKQQKTLSGVLQKFRKRKLILLLFVFLTTVSYDRHYDKLCYCNLVCKLYNAAQLTNSRSIYVAFVF